MFSKPLWDTPGLTEFQIGYVHKHINAPKLKAVKKVELWMLAVFAITIATTCGLWACILQPETVSNGIANATHFGVWILILLQIAAVFVLLLALLTVGGTDLVVAGLKGAVTEAAPTPEEAAEFKLLIDSRKMIGNRNSLASYRPSMRKSLHLTFHRTVSLVLFIGMVVQGYILAPLIMVVAQLTVIMANKGMKMRLVLHLKTLTAERVAELDAAYERSENESASQLAIDVVSTEVQ